MTAQRFGHSVDTVITPLAQHGLVEHLFTHTMLSAQHSLSGLVTQIGSRKCGKANLIVWLRNSKTKVLKALHITTKTGNYIENHPRGWFFYSKIVKKLQTHSPN
jgi:hypothetical protein